MQEITFLSGAKSESKKMKVLAVLSFICGLILLYAVLIK